MNRSRTHGLRRAGLLFLGLACALVVGCDSKGPDAPRGDAGATVSRSWRAGPPTLLAAEDGSRRYALLVAVSDYRANPAIRRLEGPPNDIQLMKRLLTGARFGFAEAELTVLEAADGRRQPTRANILQELDALAKRAKPGDQVVVYLSGHGSRIPRRPDRRDTNPHGLTGVFLPQDTGSWEGAKVENAIEDWEVAERARAIVATGAKLWLITDSCHSGGLVREKVRGAGEVSRDVPARDLGVPDELMIRAHAADRQRHSAAAGAAAAAAAPEATRGTAGGEGRSGFAILTDSPDLAATYACRSFEETPERRFPMESAEPLEGPFGLFTYTLCQVLNSTEAAMTYEELLRRVNGQYDSWGRNASPYAIAEGKGRHQFVLGQGERRTPIRLLRADGRLLITAGRLHGVNPGSVLAILPPPGDPSAGAEGAARAKPVGHVRVTSAQTYVAVVEPTRFADMPAPAARDLMPDAACRLVYVDYGIEPLRVYVGEDPASPEFLKARERRSAAAAGVNPDELRQEAMRIIDGLKRADPREAAFLTLVDRPEQAQWLVVPWPGEPGKPRLHNASAHADRFQPSDDDPDAVLWVRNGLRKIARAQALLKIGQTVRRSAFGRTIDVALKLKLFKNADDQNPTIYEGAGGGDLTLYDQDLVTFEVGNRGRDTVDVTLLFLSSSYGIEQYYPLEGQKLENRMKPGETRQTEPLRINNKSLGTERVILIAVSSEGPVPADFGFLEEPGLQPAQARAGNFGNSPLAEALLFSQFRQGTRGGSPERLPLSEFKTLHWTTARGVRPSPGP